MKPRHFLTHLIEEGKVQRERKIVSFDPDDLKSAGDFLYELYQNDTFDTPSVF